MAKPGEFPKLSELSLEQRAAQLLGVSFYCSNPLDRSAPNRLAKFVEKRGLGLLHVAQGTAVQTREWIEYLDSLSRKAVGIPILFGADCEQGLPHSFEAGTELPWQMAIGSSEDSSAAYEAGRILGAEARALGLDLVFGPVADVNTNPQNRVIANRSFGADPEVVGRLVAAFVEGLRSAGVQAVLKHFPGHGATEEDSHLAVPYDFSEFEMIERIHLPPFVKGFEAGAAGIMTGHVVMCALDMDQPATLSPRSLGWLLREHLGYGGVAITDSLNMAGLEMFVPRADAVVHALRAGADIVLHPSSLEHGCASIVEAVKQGALSEQVVNDAARRVLALKKRCVPNRVQAKGGLRSLREQAEPNARCAQAIADKGVTLVSEPPMPALPDAIEIVVAIDDASRALDVSTGFVGTLLAARPGTRVHDFRESTADKTIEDINGRLQAGHGATVVAVLCPMMFFKGRSRLSPRLAHHLRAVMSGLPTPHAVVVFGVPYVLHGLGGTVRLCAYGPSAPSQVAAARVLLGELEPNVNVPVQWPGYD